MARWIASQIGRSAGSAWSSTAFFITSSERRHESLRCWSFRLSFAESRPSRSGIVR